MKQKNTIKTAVVYDKWLHSLGGGEVVACTIARILRDQGYAVTLVGGKAFDIRKIKSKLGIDIDSIQFDWLWNDEYRLHKITQACDVFFNTTYMDYSHASGTKSFYYTHFPTEAYLSIKGYVFNHLVAPLFTRWFQQCEFATPKHEIIINGRYGYVLEDTNTIFLTHNSREKRVLSFSLFYENYVDSLIRNIKIHIDHADIIQTNVKMDPHHNILHYKLVVQPHSDTLSLSINLPRLPKTHYYPENRTILLFPRTLPQHILTTFLKRILYRVETRLRAGIYVNVLKRLATYSHILSNSAFTAQWVQRYWKMPSVILYPPVETLQRVPLSRKKKQICSVGRFFVLGHGKKQEVMIEAFKNFYDRNNTDWQLHLVGSVDSQDKESMAFVDRLNQLAKGYPVFIHLNASRKKMEDIVSSSMIYWHATGFGEDENTDPIKFEHFGISTIEAISAGCIPVLYRGGGLPEIIHKLGLSNDNLYTTIDQLVDKTILSINNAKNYGSKKVCSLVEKHFSLKAFEKALVSLLRSS